MLSSFRRLAVTVAALAALALGGAAIAGAADKSSSSGSGASQTRPPRDELSGATAAKVKAAALEKVPGATVLRTEAGGPHGTAYHAHVKTSDGALKVVLVNASFEATAVQVDQGRGGGKGPGGHRGGPGAGETPLTGDTKAKATESAG